jgi:hypothetical protein
MRRKKVEILTTQKLLLLNLKSFDILSQDGYNTGEQRQKKKDERMIKEINESSHNAKQMVWK